MQCRVYRFLFDCAVMLVILIVIPECELVFEDGPDEKLLKEKCEKNPGHPSFTSIKNFTVDDLPPSCQTKEMMDLIKYYSDTTVKISVSQVSSKRPDTYPNSNLEYPYSKCKGSNRMKRIGTGSFFRSSLPRKVDMKCPCGLCKSQPYENRKGNYYVVQVHTAIHVIFDESEAESAVCELFYDGEDRTKVKCLYGYTSGKYQFEDENDSDHYKLTVECKTDYCIMSCVTHDKELAGMIENMLISPKGIEVEPQTYPLAFIISHPHGRSKCITLGREMHYAYPRHQNHTADNLFTIEPDTKCQVDINFSAVSNDSLHQIINFDAPCDSGSNAYRLEQKITLKLPSDTTYFCKSIVRNDKFINNFLQDETEWRQFPSGTTFTIGDKTESIPLPNEVKFEMHFNKIAKFVNLDFVTYFYDVDTCPGSSGAPVLFNQFGDDYHRWVYHAGLDGTGLNRSGAFFQAY